MMDSSRRRSGFQGRWYRQSKGGAIDVRHVAGPVPNHAGTKMDLFAVDHDGETEIRGVRDGGCSCGRMQAGISASAGAGNEKDDLRIPP